MVSEDILSRFIFSPNLIIAELIGDVLLKNRDLILVSRCKVRLFSIHLSFNPTKKKNLHCEYFPKSLYNIYNKVYNETVRIII